MFYTYNHPVGFMLNQRSFCHDGYIGKFDSVLH